MPSITTHYIFSKEVLNKLDKKERDIFDSKLDIYHTFAQSHDYLFYYKFGKKHKEINKLGRYAHHNNTQEYILNIIKEIKDENDNIINVLYLIYKDADFNELGGI
jgi:hypothetical protein